MALPTSARAFDEAAHAGRAMAAAHWMSTPLSGAVG